MAPKATVPAGESKRVLIVMLVFFILATIGAGLAAYYGFAEQEKLTAAADKAKKLVKISDDERDWYRFQAGMYRAYLGALAAPDSSVGRDLPDLKGKFDKGEYGKEQKDFAEVKDLVTKLNARSPWDAAKSAPREPFEAVVKALQGEIDGLKKEVAKANTEAAVDKVLRTATQADRKKDQDAFSEAIDKNKKEFEGERKGYAKRIEDLEKVLAAAQDNKDLTFVQPIVAENLKLRADIASLGKQVKERDENILKLSARLPSAGAGTASEKPADPVARGKVLRVHINPRKVTIDLGKAHGLTAQTTFAIHGYQPNGKPKVRSKANLEVINVGETTSECLITEVFSPNPDTDSLATGKRKVIDQFSPDATDPVVTGDALINPTWNPNAKTHIVIAGLIDLAGTGAINMASLVQVLERQSIIVDAYLDPIDGTIKGRGVGKYTDFVLLGIKPTERDPGAPRDPVILKTMGENYDKLINDAKASAIPLKQPHIFFRETGFNLPKTVVSD